MSQTIVISLGGSLIVPDQVDTAFLQQFRNLILSYTQKDKKFIIVCGGGKTARRYQEALSTLHNSEQALDWMGIHATTLNAQLVRSMFGEEAETSIISNPTTPGDMSKNIAIASGWKPGCSTDYDAVLLAKQFGGDHVINMSNVDYVYDSDPKKNSNAQPVTDMTWENYRKMVGDTWKPGMNLPFDPIAAKEAQKESMKVTIIGSDLDNLKNVLDDKEFKGSVLHG